MLSILPGSPAWGERVATSLARALSVAPDGTALLLEWRSGSPGWELGVADDRGWSVVLEATRGHDVRVRRVDAPPARGLPREVRFGTLDGPDDPPRGGPGDAGEAPGRIAPLDPLPSPGAPSGGGSVQLHLWSLGTPDRLGGSIRFAIEPPSSPDGPGGRGTLASLAAALRGRSIAAGVRHLRPRFGRRREWATGALRSFRSRPTLRIGPEAVGAIATELAPRTPDAADRGRRALVVFGSSGAGKTRFLARRAVEAVRAGGSVVAVDVHGDLGPEIVGRLGRPGLDRVLVVDAGADEGVIAGIDVFGGLAADRAAPHLVAAFRRSSDDDGERYWGFRLERIFDEFVRLALEEGGNLRDLYDLLTDERRREAARLATTSPTTARFLEELRGILRRNPEFLWPAAARLSKIRLSGPLLRALAPPAGGIDLDAALDGGASLVARFPIGRLGPEAAHLAATMFVARCYLGRTSAERRPDRRVLLVIDEAQSVAPALLAEILAEGRKFGVDLLLATQHPGRLDPRLRDTAAACAASHIVLRTPRAAVSAVAPWLGLPEPALRDALPGLSPGSRIATDPGDGRPGLFAPEASDGTFDPDAWAVRRAATAREIGADGDPGPDPDQDRELLFRIRSEELGAPPSGPAPDAAARLRRRGLVAPGPDGRERTTPAGRAWLGELGPTGAVREGAEHRALLAEAYRIFARRGERLEIVRQGRFDTTLPDARLQWLDAAERAASPGAIARILGERATRWAFRAFGGRDVFVEAEVSGAERRARIARDLDKARRAGAHCLFLVGDPRHASRIRAVIAASRGRAPPATVWVLRVRYRSGAGDAGDLTEDRGSDSVEGPCPGASWP